MVKVDVAKLVGASIDQARTRSAVPPFGEESGIDSTTLDDAQGRVTRAFRTVAVPEIFLINPTER